MTNSDMIFSFIPKKIFWVSLSFIALLLVCVCVGGRGTNMWEDLKGSGTAWGYWWLQGGLEQINWASYKERFKDLSVCLLVCQSKTETRPGESDACQYEHNVIEEWFWRYFLCCIRILYWLLNVLSKLGTLRLGT